MGEAGASVAGFDPIIHAPARLKLMMLLASTSVASFNRLADEAGLTAGNLASHLKALEAAGYVESRRGLVDLKPRVRYRITDAGRAALREYVRVLEETLLRLRDVAGVADGKR